MVQRVFVGECAWIGHDTVCCKISENNTISYEGFKIQTISFEISIRAYEVFYTLFFLFSFLAVENHSDFSLSQFWLRKEKSIYLVIFYPMSNKIVSIYFLQNKYYLDLVFCKPKKHSKCII